MSNGSEHMRPVPPPSDLEIIRADVAELKATVQNLIDLIEPIKKDIAPMMDQLADSSLFKMIVGK